VDCFISLGISLIIAQSFGAIYKRNAINSGLPILSFPELEVYINQKKLETGDIIEVNLLSGEIKNVTKGINLRAKPMGQVQLDIYRAGNLFKYGRKSHVPRRKPT
ncbi:MAG: 3-isopropylmalate dehydratase, partial [Candidatus Aminicenantia bacterium]